MTSKEALERIEKSHYVAMACMGIDKPDIETEKAIKTIEQELEKYDQLKLDYPVVEKYACKYKSLISGKLWRDGKERTKWFNKIRNQKDWIDDLSKLREYESNDEEQFLRIVKHLDTQVLYWALLSLEQEIKRYSEEVKENENFL